jgi:tetratricopeptide (TPR) repeat protein
MSFRQFHRRGVAFLAALALFSGGNLPAQQSNPGAAAVAIDARRAQKAAERGDKAANEGRYAEALAAYDEAARYAPNDPAIVGRSARLRSRMVREHVEAAERLALGSHMREAVDELNAALRIDPGDTIVAERLAEMKQIEENPAEVPARQSIQGLPSLRPQGTKQNLAIRGDTRTAWEQLAISFGMKATFDPDLPAKPVKFKVEDVDFYTAAALLGAQTGTFWKPVTASQLFVAADTQEKRRQYAVVAEQNFPLTGSVSPEEMTELLRILRDITGTTHVQLSTQDRSISVRDSPDKLALAGEIIREAERARNEVMLEFELLEVDRDAARKLGVQFPSSAKLISVPTNLLSQLQQAKDLTSLLTILAGLFGTSAAGATSLSSVVPPFVVVGGGRSTFLLTLPAAVANFSDALSVLQSGRQVLLRAQHGKPATFFVGDRFPVTLSLLSQSLGTGGSVPAVGGTVTNTLTNTVYPAGNGTRPLVAADFRNIGQLDLASVNELDNTLSVFLNQGPGVGAGTYAAAPKSPTALGAARSASLPFPQAMASAVLTSSGFHDLLITEPDKNDVLVLLSNGDGTFSAPAAPALAAIPVGNGPSGIVSGDFNADGNLDFAVSNEEDNSVSVFLGDGKGGFAEALHSPFAFAKTLTIANTALPDAVQGAPYNVRLVAEGGLAPVSWTITAGNLPPGLTLNAATGTITGTPTGPGTPTITARLADSSSPQLSIAAVFDLNVTPAAPGLAISATSLSSGGIGTPYTDTLTAVGGKAPFTWSIVSGGLPTGLTLNSATGAITGTPSTKASFTFTVQVSDSSAPALLAQKVFTLTPSSDPERGPAALVAADFRNQGTLDLAVLNETTGNVAILLNGRDATGNLTFSEPTAPIAVGKNPVALVAGDLDDNGTSDLAVVNQGDNTVSVLLNNGDATFVASPVSPLTTGKTPTAIAAGDFDGNRSLDLAVTNSGDGTASVFLNAGVGVLALALEPLVGTNPAAIVAAPLSGQTLPDFAVTNNPAGARGDINVILSPAETLAAANGGALQQPYPGSEYVDLGVKVKATPSIHPGNEVTLQLEFEIRALAGSSVNGIPVISNRTISQTVRVKEGVPSLIAGLTDSEETAAVTGLPGFANLPGVGYAFGSRSTDKKNTELLILVTPRRLRDTRRVSRTIFGGRGSSGPTPNVEGGPPPQP